MGGLSLLSSCSPMSATMAWVEDTLFDLRDCLIARSIPDADPNCDFCGYASARADNEWPAQGILPLPLDRAS